MAPALSGKARGEQTEEDLGSRWEALLGTQASLALGCWGFEGRGGGISGMGSSQGNPPLCPDPGSAHTSSSSPESDSGSTGTSSSSPIVPIKPSSSSMLPEQLLPEISTARRPTLLFRDALVVTAYITSVLRKPRQSNCARTLRVRMRQHGAWLREPKSRGGDLF